MEGHPAAAMSVEIGVANKKARGRETVAADDMTIAACGQALKPPGRFFGPAKGTKKPFTCAMSFLAREVRCRAARQSGRLYGDGSALRVHATHCQPIVINYGVLADRR